MVEVILLLLFFRLKNLYNCCVECLCELVVNNLLGDYLCFVVLIVYVQEVVLYDYLLQMDFIVCIKVVSEQGKLLLDIYVLLCDKYWYKLLYLLIVELKLEMSGLVLVVIENLEKVFEQELEQMVSVLFVFDFVFVSSDKVLFIWVVLLFYWVQMVSLISGKVCVEYGEQCQFCLVCGLMFVFSIV